MQQPDKNASAKNESNRQNERYKGTLDKGQNQVKPKAPPELEMENEGSLTQNRNFKGKATYGSKH